MRHQIGKIIVDFSNFGCAACHQSSTARLYIMRFIPRIADINVMPILTDLAIIVCDLTVPKYLWSNFISAQTTLLMC
ncbi:hypothetical protein CAF53_26695 [Sphingobium sp. LB126]|nr:hypothetical protein CAF53_26695 [Sphingobium sp. LB126]